MAPQLHDVGRKLQAWMIPLAASVQTIGQLVISLVEGYLLGVLVWWMATVTLMFLAASIESVKRFLGE